MSGPLAITVAAPASKSISHRKIIAASLARGVSHLANVLESEDIARTTDIMRALGASIERTGEGEYAVIGMGSLPQAGRDAPLSCWMAESGTSCRLLTAVLAAGTGRFRIHGAPRLHERPLADLTDALTSLGAAFSFEGKPGFPPMVLHARGLTQPSGASWLPVRCEVSSQFLSGLLLAAPLAVNGLGLLLAGEKAVSWPYVGLTLQTLEDAGCGFIVEILREGVWAEADWRSLAVARPGATRFRVYPGAYRTLAGRAGIVEGDFSGASYLLAAGAIGPRPVSVTNLRRDSLQGDAAILGILEAMGAKVSWNGDAATVSPGALTGVEINMGNCPDLVPTVAVLASLAKGATRIMGVPHLRGKESDRLAATAVELAKTGCRIVVTADGLDIYPVPERARGGAIEFSAHNDHRMAMCLALLELVDIKAMLDTPGCVAKSFPTFWKTWRAIHPETRIGEKG